MPRPALPTVSDMQSTGRQIKKNLQGSRPKTPVVTERDSLPSIAELEKVGDAIRKGYRRN